VLAVIVLRFEPYAQVAGLTIPLRAVGVTLAILAAVALAGALARRSSELRLDDLLYLVVAAIPGAVLGGRLVYGLAYLDFYARDPGQFVDPARGGLSLLGAVIGGTLSAALVARLLDAPVRAWADVAAAPLLLGIGLGKLALLLGGGGQGMPSDAPWAVALAGSGPWLSARADVPAHPSQVYEGLCALLGVPLVLILGRSSRWRRWWSGESYGPSGRRPGARPLGYGPRTGLASEPIASGAATGYLMGGALVWWLAGRFLVGFTWRDERGIGPLAAEQALALVALGALMVAAVAANRAEHRAAPAEAAVPDTDPAIPPVSRTPDTGPASPPAAGEIGRLDSPLSDESR
jgi:prolipoprotein diacylglyceryltransferase